jgi:hypothetical protein
MNNLISTTVERKIAAAAGETRNLAVVAQLAVRPLVGHALLEARPVQIGAPAESRGAAGTSRTEFQLSVERLKARDDCTVSVLCHAARVADGEQEQSAWVQ